MLKVMGLLKRRPDLELDAFQLHWRTIHRGLALRLAHAGILGGYVQNHRLEIAIDGLVPFADGVPELWFDCAAALDGMRDSAAYSHGAFHDSPRFMDVDHYDSLLLESEDDVAAPSRRECAGLLKAMIILEDFPAGHIADSGESLVLGPIAPVRLSYHRASTATSSIETGRCAAVETSWWADLPSFRRAWQARRVGGQVSGILVEEKPVFWPGDVPPPADWSPVETSERHQA